MGWKKDFSIKFERDELRRLISRVNWFTFKPKIKEQLETISKELSEDKLKFYLTDMKDEPNGYGFDSITLQISERMTGNMREEKFEKHTRFNYHRQKGAYLSIMYSATGAVHMMLFPSSSEDSLAKHDTLILHYSYNVKDITEKKIEKAVRKMLHYHRVTGVLHKATIWDRLVVRAMKIRMFFIQYLDKDKKFQRVTALYIPTISLIISVAAVIISVLAIVLAK